MLETFFIPIFRIGILLILFLYAIFSILIVRQVTLMSKTLQTSVSPLIKAISIVHAGVAIGLVFLMYGMLK